MDASPLLRFAEFELDAAAGELRKHGRKVKLAPQPFRLLSLLVNSGGELLTREAIRRQLWNGTFVDFEHGLNFCIREIRCALGDSPRRPRFIETHPKRGYRFVASVSGHPRSTVISAAAAKEPEDAQELYSAGRRYFREMGTGGLEQAKTHFEEALRLDPEYARAHSGLGATHAMRYIHRSDPSDLEQAEAHLRRASDLDPELPEPYPWLCYVYTRRGELEKAWDAGQRGVQLRPDLVHAHYFLGLAYFVACERDAKHYGAAIEYLRQAGAVDSRWPATWFVLTCASLLNGKYDLAERFANLLLQYGAGGSIMPRFVGGENLLGTLWLRRGNLARARGLFAQSLETLSASDHAYSEGMRVWSACGLGDVNLREGTTDDALANYRKAWQILQESPTMTANQRHSARALSGLAAAYATRGENNRAVRLLSQAKEFLEKCSNVQTAAAGAHLADLHYAFAIAYMCCEDSNQTVIHLRRAFDAGWRDADWLQRDPKLSPLRDREEFSSLVQKIRSFPDVFAGVPPEAEG